MRTEWTDNIAEISAERLLVHVLVAADTARRNNDPTARRTAQGAADALMDRITADPNLIIQANTDRGQVTAKRWDKDESYPGGAYCHENGVLYRATVTTRGNHPERTGAWLPISVVVQNGLDATATVDRPTDEQADWWTRICHWCGCGKGDQ